MDMTFPTIMAVAALYYLHLHFNFWRALKTEAPMLYRKHSEFSPSKYTCGFKWVEYALRKEYHKLENPRVTKCGEALSKAYMGYDSAIGLTAFLILVSFAIWMINFIIYS